MPTKQPHSIGVDDRMTLINATPDPERGGAFEWQTFECSTCLNKVERGVNKQDDPHRK
jgi:hypothetical protein